MFCIRMEWKSYSMPAQVLTSNVNFMNMIDCRSRSNYLPDPHEHAEKTVYDFAVVTSAFPGKPGISNSARFQIAGINRKIEEFVGGCLVGNVKQSELKINEFIARLRSDCIAGRSKVWLCGMLRQESKLAAASCMDERVL